MTSVRCVRRSRVCVRACVETLFLSSLTRPPNPLESRISSWKMREEEIYVALRSCAPRRLSLAFLHAPPTTVRVLHRFFSPSQTRAIYRRANVGPVMIARPAARRIRCAREKESDRAWRTTGSSDLGARAPGADRHPAVPSRLPSHALRRAVLRKTDESSPAPVPLVSSYMFPATRDRFECRDATQSSNADGADRRP